MKALKFYKELKESEPSTSSRESNPQFSASTGWLTGFIKRHSFHNLKIKGEVASADEEAARNYPEKRIACGRSLNDDDILESMVDITKDLETVDSEPEEDVTPLDEKLLRKGLQLSVPEEALPCRSDDVILSSSDESDLAPIHKRKNPEGSELAKNSHQHDHQNDPQCHQIGCQVLNRSPKGPK
ncbi:hypothetical protein TNCV_1060761 [Trichonephila clavipes]|nr:hypothetical protein TNCV_1060761 [Trichonephila clavipes]